MLNEENYEISKLVKQGGIYFEIEGGNKKEILTNLIYNGENGASLDILPGAVLSKDKRALLLNAVIEREALISTGIENGIALPHPRTPLLEANEKPFVAIAFPKQPAEWGTPDNELVRVVFLIVSESPKQHLNVLTKINYLCMDKDFYNLIAASGIKIEADKDKIIAAIQEAENKWRKL